ncbi:peptide ABC transporter substrate-binding protein [Metabacillus malikii]|uniref:Peptide ABC transporter substrate-binding protein n=1 Tax=Metabacillus malikii TaxID=1504265 RepID=A0ABT9ZN39_9BACI|nr:peptide ABC transporter substrate-binding protein [Metabacillus malikii]MDQ0233344.1 hypothetical protein [Metabacillus malikii]
MKFKYISLLLIFPLFLMSCSIEVKPKEHMRDIYIVALETIMEQDESLNKDVKFIAIDMGNFEKINQHDKEYILTSLKETYNVDVFEATFEQLKEKGLYDEDTMSLDGVLLTIDNIQYTFNNQVQLEGSKYRSSLGAVGIEVKVHYNDDKWQTKDMKDLWIS